MQAIQALVLYLLCTCTNTQIITLSDSLHQQKDLQPATATPTITTPGVAGLPTGLTSCSSPEFNGGCNLGTYTALYGILTFDGCRTTSDASVFTQPPVTSMIAIYNSITPYASVITSFTTVNDVGRSNFEVIVSQEVNTTVMDPISLAYSSYVAQPGTCRTATTTGLDYRSQCVTLQPNSAGSTITVPITASVPYITAQKVLCGELNPCCALCWFQFDVCQNAKGCSNQKNYFKCIDGMRYNVPGGDNGNPYIMTGVPLDTSNARRGKTKVRFGLFWVLQIFLLLL